jgi:hypothetical protein
MEGIGTSWNCVVLCLAPPFIGLIILSNVALEAIARRWGSAGRLIRLGWLFLTVLFIAAVIRFAITSLGSLFVAFEDWP